MSRLNSTLSSSVENFEISSLFDVGLRISFASMQIPLSLLVETASTTLYAVWRGDSTGAAGVSESCLKFLRFIDLGAIDEAGGGGC